MKDTEASVLKLTQCNLSISPLNTAYRNVYNSSFSKYLKLFRGSVLLCKHYFDLTTPVDGSLPYKSIVCTRYLHMCAHKCFIPLKQRPLYQIMWLVNSQIPQIIHNWAAHDIQDFQEWSSTWLLLRDFVYLIIFRMSLRFNFQIVIFISWPINWHCMKYISSSGVGYRY